MDWMTLAKVTKSLGPGGEVQRFLRLIPAMYSIRIPRSETQTLLFFKASQVILILRQLWKPLIMSHLQMEEMSLYHLHSQIILN